MPFNTPNNEQEMEKIKLYPNIPIYTEEYVEKFIIKWNNVYKTRIQLIQNDIEIRSKNLNKNIDEMLKSGKKFTKAEFNIMVKNMCI